MVACINDISLAIPTIKEPYSLKNKLPPKFSHSIIACVFHGIPKYPFILRKRSTRRRLQHKTNTQGTTINP